MAQGIDILLVEDEDEQAEVIELALATSGWSVVRARDGRSGIDLAERLRPRLLLLDLVMPQVDGFGVLRALRGRPGAPPVVAMSAFREFLPDARRLGALWVLAKPFDLAELERVVRKGLSGAAAPPPPEAAPVRFPGLEAPHASEEERDELQRLERLHCLRVMEAEPDAALDELVRVTAELLRTPVAVVSIITEDRQWWKAMHGVGGELAQNQGSARDLSFCSHAIAAHAPLIVSDAREHPAFRDNQLVREGLLDAYAGVPVEIAGVGALGTLCVLDTRRRVFTSADLELLGLLARRVAAEIEWRERDRGRPLGTLRYLALVDERRGIYNADAFRSFVDVIARQAFLRQGSFALVGFDRAPRKPWPVAPDPRSVDLLVEAVRAEVGRRAVLGWLDDRIVVALLPDADEARSEEVRCGVLDREALARRRLGDGEIPAPVGVARTARAVLRTRPLLEGLRRAVQEQLGQRPPTVGALAPLREI